MKKTFFGIFSSIKNFIIDIFTSRFYVVALVFIVMFCILFGRLFYLQIIMADHYRENFTQKSERTVYHSGARGDIYDCNGVLLAHNEIAYSVYMTDLIPSSDEKGEIINGIIYDTIKIIEENGDSIVEDFNIEALPSGKLIFKEAPVTPKITFLCNVYGMKSDELHDKGYISKSAEEVFEYLCSEDRFDISDEYAIEDRIKICTIRYALSLNSYQKYISTEIAMDVGDKTRAAISENKAELTGVGVDEYYKRVYDQGEYIASIVGYTGQISEEEMKNYNLTNELNLEYNLGDIVGKSGIEKSYDAYLQGTKGEDVVFVDAKGNVIDTVSSTKSGSGNDIYLTIDSKLQEAGYHLLEQELAGILVSKLVDWDYVPEENADIIYIPIKDVYYKMLTNVINVNDFDDEDASEREKNTLRLFNERKKEVLDEIRAELEDQLARPVSQLSPEFNEYMFYTYDYLGELGILQKDAMDQNSSTYQRWSNEQISLREFLMDAISENWIDSALLDPSTNYADSTQIYKSILDSALEGLETDSQFAKKIYYHMIYNGMLSGYDICMMLYDQEKISNENGMRETLASGNIGAYDFMMMQIRDLVITPSMVALDPCSGSLIITDTASGKVKALVSYPSYDNNRLSGKIDNKYWNEINNDDSLPLFNKATQGLTAPGSTFKPLTSIAGLAEGVISTGTYIYDEGTFERVTPSPHCWISPGSHGDVDMATALQVSCNYYYYTVGYNLGFSSASDQTYNSGEALAKIENYAIQVGLDSKSGIELDETEPRFSTTDSVRTAIGQGTNGYTTSQLGRYVNTVARKGENYQLSIVDRVLNKKGATIKKVDPVMTNKMDLSEDGWNTIHDGMTRVTQSGTAMGVFLTSPVQVAGKTGTAQENTYRSNHAVFVGFSPYVNPEVSFACVIRNGDSSTYPTEVCKDAMEYYYGYTELNDILAAKAKDITEARSQE